MQAKIEVEKVDATHFRVRVAEGGSESTHQVTLDPKEYARLAGGTGKPKISSGNRSNFCWNANPRNRSSAASIFP